ncbi:hypothetical protein H6G33_36550 [Calothrix sp. FACHB-1219]|nr:hypothetical protein [Calothrix sp. FACHB-168]MBD2222443.1 hypothetical protein [Calothrix sp. FACHB-1219]
MLGSGLGYGFNQVVSNTKQQELPAQPEVRHVNLIEYERLQLEMTLTDVRAILSSNGTEVDRTPTTVTFVWDNLDGSKITAIFENGRLKSKQQSRLK